MSEFSWMYCDKDNAENLRFGMEAYLLNPNGKPFYEPSYDGDGFFGNVDVYEKALDWNRNDLDASMLVKPLPQEFMTNARDSGGELNMYRDGDTDIEMERYAHKTSFCSHAKDWKRALGIAISCRDEQNEKLPFPIKVSSMPLEYQEVGASKTDPNDGYGEDYVVENSLDDMDELD